MKKTGVFLLAIILLLSMNIALATDYKTIPTPTTDEQGNAGNGYYEATYADNPTSGETVSFTRQGITIGLQPHSLNWNNALSQLQQINMPQNVARTKNINSYEYPNAYGQGITLRYTNQWWGVKEEIIIESYSDLGTIEQYVINGGTPYLEANFILTTNAQKIIVEGAEWDKTTQTTTENEIYILDNEGNVLYHLPRPIAIDNEGNTIYGSYKLKKSGSKLYIGITIPQNWLATAAYPVKIDPTFFVDYSPIPASHLIHGFTLTDPDFNFTTVLDITAGISDDNDSTTYSTRLNNLTYYEITRRVYKFEETSGNTTFNHGLFGSYMQLYGSPNLNVGGIDGSAIDFDGINDYGIITDQANISATQDILVCISANDAGASSTNTFFDFKGSGASQGVELILNPADTISGFVRRGATQTTITSTTTIDDSQWHTICFYSDNNGTVELYIDQVLEASATGVTGAATPSVDIFIGASDTLGNKYGEKLDELCAWISEDMNHTDMIAQYNQTYCGDPEGTAITGDWNETYDDSYNWFMRVRKTSSGTETIIINAYEDEDEISNQSTNQIISGTGWFNIPIDNIMSWQQNNTALNHTRMRIHTTDETKISEIRLRKEANDTTAPTINNCYTNTTTLACGEIASITCNVTDDLEVKNVTATINGTHNMIKADDLWNHVFTPIIEEENNTYYWTLTTAYDLSGLNDTLDPNITIQHECSLCTEDWEAQYANLTSCRTNNTIIQETTYVDNNACGTNTTLPVDNGTTSENYCNYCDPDWQDTGTECYVNSTRYVEYTDYNLCYAVTGLIEDSPPFDDETWVSCQYFESDFNCTISSVPYMNNKMEYTCTLPNNDEYSCINYITYGLDDVLQVNPQKIERVQGGLINIDGILESRESFTTTNGLLNAYFTKKNLVADNDFTITTICSNDNETLTHQQLISPTLKNLDKTPTQLIWIKDNMTYIIILILILIAIAILLGSVIAHVKGRK